MKHQPTVRKKVTELVESQLLAVLSTHREGQPYANLVAFTQSEDLSEIYFATGRSTRKFTNIQQDNRVALLIDSRTNQEADFHSAAAVTIIGSIVELEGQQKEEAQRIYLARHPYLKDFVLAPTTALLRVDVSRYILVTRFQEVFELHMDE